MSMTRLAEWLDSSYYTVIDTPGFQHVIPAGEMELHEAVVLHCPCDPEFGPPCEECAEATGGPEGCRVCEGTGIDDKRQGYEGPLLVIHCPLVVMKIEAYEG